MRDSVLRRLRTEAVGWDHEHVFAHSQYEVWYGERLCGGEDIRSGGKPFQCGEREAVAGVWGLDHLAITVIDVDSAVVFLRACVGPLALRGFLLEG